LLNGDAPFDVLGSWFKLITGQIVTLNAARDINLLSAQDTNTQTSSNSSSGGSIGVGANLGGQQNGFTIELAASAAKGDWSATAKKKA
jgi:filamentous hemagglutinin